MSDAFFLPSSGFALEDALATLSSGAHEASALGADSGAGPASAVWRHPLPLGLGLLTLCLGGVLAWSLVRTPPAPPREPIYLSLMLPPD